MDVLTRKEDGILTIQLNRPAKKNALTVAMYQMMAEAITDAEEDESVRVLLFCAGPTCFALATICMSSRMAATGGRETSSCAV